MSFQYITKPEWKIDTPGFENIIYGESTNGVHREEAEEYCRGYGPDFRLPSADEAIAFRSAIINYQLQSTDWKGPRFADRQLYERMQREEQYAIAPQLTDTVFAYLRVNGKPHFAFADPRTPRVAAELSSSEEHDGLVKRFNSSYDKRSDNKPLTLPISDSGVRTLIWRAELTDRIVPVPEIMFMCDPLNGAQHLSLSTTPEENGTSQYGQSPIVKAILPKTSEMNATTMQRVEQRLKEGGERYTDSDGIIHSSLPYIKTGGYLSDLEKLSENKVVIGTVSIHGNTNWNYNSTLNKIYLTFERSVCCNNRVRPVREDVGEPRFVNVNESWHLFCGKG